MSRSRVWLLLLPVLLVLAPAAPRADEEKDDQEQVPPPSSWKPAGEITPPAEGGPPSPMISYGEFELDVHGRVQALAGLVGDDAHVMDGDTLSRDGFRIRRARLGLEGKLLEEWEYGLELDLIDEDAGGNALLDAWITWRPCGYAFVEVGAGKLPFSRILIKSSADMQFIERPVWVNVERANENYMLDPGRQVGVTVGGEVSLLRYAVGVYNGAPGFSTGDLNDGLMYVARLGVGMGEMGRAEADLDRGGLRWELGVNGYLNQAQASEIRAAGIDLGVKFEGISFYAEVLWAKSVPATRPEGISGTLDETETWGMAAQAGYLLPFSFADLEIACRFAITDDNVHVDNEGDLWELTAGLNAYLAGDRLKAMINYVLKEERQGADLQNDAVMAMLQAMF